MSDRSLESRTAGEHASRMQTAWDEAALGYDGYFAPRFSPYLGAAVGALATHRDALPGGPVLVPCVGPGHELVALSRVFPERLILASDLAPVMVELARTRAARLRNVTVERGDAAALRVAPGSAAAVYSAFGLQLLPDPALALEHWLGLLSPGGVAAIVYWPELSEVGSPFHVLRELLVRGGVQRPDWESALPRAIASASTALRLDTRIAFEMTHEDAASLWHALTHLGPLRALAIARGASAVAELGAEFVRRVPTGTLAHAPEARLLLLERR